MLNFEQIKELAALVAEKNLGSLELERAGFRLHIVASPISGVGRQTIQRESPSLPAFEPGVVFPEATALKGEDRSSQSEDAPVAHTVTSPIVGTFYRAPNPEGAPYVRVGDRVSKGQVICVVEAMKLMNEIECDVDGVVIEVLPENAQPVEFGEPLFAIATD